MLSKTGLTKASILFSILLILGVLTYVFSEELGITKNDCERQKGLCVAKIVEYSDDDPCGERGQWVSEGADQNCRQLTRNNKPVCCIVTVPI